MISAIIKAVNSKLFFFLGASCWLVSCGYCFGKNVLIEKGAGGWQYFDRGEAPAEGWNKSADFAAEGWGDGVAPLGYGDDGLGTELSFGEDVKKKHPATYLRKTFSIPEGVEIAQLRGSLRCDDGAAIYLNGEPIARYNLGSDPVTHETLARHPISGAQELAFLEFEIDVEGLVEGDNVIAVSVHQISPTSSDLVFDFELTGLTADELPKPAFLREGAREVVDLYHKGHFVQPGVKIPDGYVDGGTYMRIKEDGAIVATREVITVDRERDAKLREHIEFANSVSDLPLVERATKLAEYVDGITTPEGGRELAEPATRKLRAYRNREILLGEVAPFCGGGVCRHRSLLFKILGDEAGLKIGLRRGQMIQRGRAIGRHAWNEITLEDGTIRIVDVMNPKEDFVFPSESEAAPFYGDIKGEPLYKKAESGKKESEPVPEKDEEKEAA